ncbi:type I phosphomannose isomerase catalytic subunit [Flavobacterium antarcticum]|uniref:type I phosphomannose isomerase catalytic subunit n=1 Tax=Flavobacterium antarcticum TaxID=271155 RepID=UPI0003B69580|nr:type I phosphomannose isomerase catalytic subunit [Flavobacterium antarcticum]
MHQQFYPLQFDPILKQKIWGGEKLKTQFNKSIVSNTTGESWELSAVQNAVSIISNGAFKGKLITDLIESFPIEILGTFVYQRFGKEFPLLFKILDAKEDLSIQVHPNDVLAKERHNSLGKTEMWYIMQADKDAEIIVGFKENATESEYLEKLQSNKLPTILNQITVQEGDAFFLETGTIHSIGAGIVIAEIQQTSDITYRLYDFDRRDETGNKRELHVDLALEAINYQKQETQKFYFKEPNKSNPIVECPYFTTNFLPLAETLEVTKEGDSFTVYMCVEGAFSFESEGSIYEYKKGDTILIPAALKNYVLHGNASILEIYIK